MPENTFTIDALVIPARSVGRPTVVDDQTVQKLEEAFKYGATDAEACRIAGISQRTYYDHRRNSKDFRRKMNLSKEWSIIAAKKVVVGSIRKGKNIESAKWWLERKRPDEFGKRDSLFVNFDPHDHFRKIIGAIKKNSQEAEVVDEIQPTNS